MNFIDRIKLSINKGSRKIKGLLSVLKFPNLNTIVAANALLLSACALYISVQEVRIMRVQQKATMFPYLTVTKTYNSDGYSIILKNSGNGLAKINSYRSAMCSPRNVYGNVVKTFFGFLLYWE